MHERQHRSPDLRTQRRLRQGGACVGHGRLPQALCRGRRRLRGLLGPPGARASELEDALHPGAGHQQGAVLQVVRRRHAERLLQLPGPQRRARPGRQDRDHLRGRRRRGHQGQLQRAAGQRVPPGQRAEGAGREEGRPCRHLHVDERRGRGRDAGLRAHRRHPLGGLRRLLGAEPARPHRGHRRHDGDHRRRAGARRQAAAAEGHRRRGARAGRLRHDRQRASSTSAPAARSPGTTAATSGCTS